MIHFPELLGAINNLTTFFLRHSAIRNRNYHESNAHKK